MKLLFLVYFYILLIIYIIIKILILNLYCFVLSVYYYFKTKLIYNYKFSFLTKKDYEEDFEYLIKFLKENSPYAFKINFDELEKQKDKVCNCKNIKEFYINIIKLKDLSSDNIGHFYARYPIDFWLSDNQKNVEQFSKYILRKYNSNEFLKENYYYYYFMSLNDIYQYIKSIKKYNYIKKENPFKYKIIKNDKNEVSIYIKIKTFDYYRFDKQYYKYYLDLKNFIIKYNYVNNVYIDIRDNNGGYVSSALQILDLFYKDYKKTNFYKTYIKYSKYNQQYFKTIFNNTYHHNGYNYKNIYYLIKLSNNKNFTHSLYFTFDPRGYSDNTNIIYNRYINVIINKKCASSSQLFLDILKNCKNCSIYGDELSKGLGLISVGGYLYEAPIFVLPKTKLIFGYEGIYAEDEFDKTEPDYKIPDFLKTKEIIDF